VKAITCQTTAAVNKVLADDKSEIVRFGTAYGPVRTALAGLLDLPKELFRGCESTPFVCGSGALADTELVLLRRWRSLKTGGLRFLGEKAILKS
jgi:hypothetical protein